MSKKLCELCKAKPATVPDRNRTGRLINRVCSDCHAERLKADYQRITDLANTIQRGVNHGKDGVLDLEKVLAAADAFSSAFNAAKLAQVPDAEPGTPRKPSPGL